MKQTTVAQRLADAALKIARANHYFVGFDPATTDGISFDDYSDAYRILVDLELSEPRSGRLYETAFGVLGAACYRQHHTHLR